MYDFSKRSEVQKYFSEILEELKSAKITAVLTTPFIFVDDGIFTYMQDEPVFIRFDNGKCLVIEYYFIDELSIGYREMTEEEIEIFSRDFDDCFNRTTTVYDGINSKKPAYEDKSSLEYGRLTKIELTPVVEKYEAWVDHDIVEVEPTDETFKLITFHMDNGKKFFIEPDVAEADGYSLLWSTDAVQSETKI